jgi:hypothetical protein
MAATQVGQWTDTFNLSAGFVIPSPLNSCRQVLVAPSAGNWLVVSASWHTSPSAQTVPAISVADDQHNWWVPLARVNSAGGGAAIWACPNVKAGTSRVVVAPSDSITALLTDVAEYAGMGNHLLLASTPVTGFTNSGTSLALGALAIPSGEALTLTCAGTDNATATLSSATAGWSSLTALSATNGSDTTADARLLPRWQDTSSGPSVTYTTSVACAIHAVSVAVRVAAPTPSQPNANWPKVRFEAGFGAGVRTVPDAINWTDLTTRLLSFDSSQGRSYELNGVEAGDVAMRLRNDDGNLSPGNASGTWYPNVVDGTPVRCTATWTGRVYPVFSNNFERLPQVWRDPHWGEVNATATDAWATLNTKLSDVIQGEILLDAPYGYWPCTDSSESGTASNLAGNNTAALTQTASKEGIGAAVVAGFGGSANGYLDGLPSGTIWTQTGLTTLQSLNGYSLQYAPTTDLPPLSGGGITVEVWARMDSGTQPTADRQIFALKEAAGAIISLFVTSAGALSIMTFDASSHTRTDISTGIGPVDGILRHYTLAVTQTSWELWINGQSVMNQTGLNLASQPHWFSCCGCTDQRQHSRMFNGAIGHVAIYPRRLPYSRIVAHWWAAYRGMLNDSADQRIARLLAYAGWGGPRSISYTSPLQTFVPASDIAGQPVASNVEEAGDSEGGIVYVDSAGSVTVVAKQYRYDSTSKYTFGDRPDLGETPYAIEATIDRDPALVVNDLTMQQRHYGGQVHLSDSTSIAQRGVQDLDRASDLTDTANIGDRGSYLLAKYKAPGDRVSQIVIDPSSNPTLWPVALGVEQGDIVTVNRRPIGGAASSLRCEVLKKEHHVNFEPGNASWKVALSLGPGDADVLTLDDATLGVPDGIRVIGW